MKLVWSLLLVIAFWMVTHALGSMEDDKIPEYILELEQEGPFEVYEHFHGNVSLLDSEPRARVGSNSYPCQPPDFCVQTFSSDRWIHISGRLLERSAFAVVFPENSHLRPVVLSFINESVSDQVERVQRVDPFVVSKRVVNFIFLFDAPIKYITTSPGISMNRDNHGLSIYWPKESGHSGNEQWFYTSGQMDKSPLKLRIHHWQSAEKVLVKDLVFKPSSSVLSNPKFSHIQRVFFEPAYARALKITSKSGIPPPPLYGILIPSIILFIFFDDLFLFGQ